MRPSVRSPIADRLKSAFIHQFAGRGGASFVGKALPFGVGAVIGGAGNNLLGRRVLATSRHAFGAAPAEFPRELEPVPGTTKLELRMLGGIRSAGAAVSDVAALTVRGVGAAGRGARRMLTRRRRSELGDGSSSTDTE